MRTISLVPLLLSSADAAAQPIFEFPIGASAHGDGSADRDAVVESVALFDPPLVEVGTDSESLRAVNPITASDELFAAAQRSPLATAQITAFCGARSTVRSQVDATDDWQVMGEPHLISFFSRGQANHRISGWGDCVESFQNANRRLVFDQVDAPFLVNGAAPDATLVITAMLGALQTSGPGIPVVHAIGSISATWELWNDANRNHVIDVADRRIATHNMNAVLGDDLIGPFTFQVPISTSGAFVARFRTRTRTSMTFRPPAGAPFSPSCVVNTAFTANIAVQ